MAGSIHRGHKHDGINAYESAETANDATSVIYEGPLSSRGRPLECRGDVEGERLEMAGSLRMHAGNLRSSLTPAAVQTRAIAMAAFKQRLQNPTFECRLLQAVPSGRSWPVAPGGDRMVLAAGAIFRFNSPAIIGRHYVDVLARHGRLRELVELGCPAQGHHVDISRPPAKVVPSPRVCWLRELIANRCRSR